jgi:methionyl aminopeptidase
VIRDFVGHGIGASLHEKPEVPNYVPRGGMEGGVPGGIPLKPGMVLAIEPMLAIGTHEVGIMSDGWTVKTRDRSLAAHWEHTIAIRPDGAEILSLSSNFSG